MNISQAAVAPEQKLFGDFVSDTTSFRDVLKRTYSVVTGEAVLHFVLNKGCSVLGLEILTTYVSVDDRHLYLSIFDRFLVSQGYSSVDATAHQAVGSGYVKLFQRRSDGRTVSIRMTNSGDIFRSLFHVGWATHMFTFATHANVYCMFPELTMEMQRSVVFLRSDPVVMRQYAEFGFKFVESATVAELVSDREPHDQFTHCIPFSSTHDTDDVQSGFVLRIEDGVRVMKAKGKFP